MRTRPGTAAAASIGACAGGSSSLPRWPCSRRGAAAAASSQTSTSAADLADPSDAVAQKPLVLAAPARPPARPADLPARHPRPAQEGRDKDDNAANLASAVITHAFGQLPIYIDKAEFRLLPFKVGRPVTPAVTTRVTHHLTVPRTRLVLDAAMSSAQSRAEVLHDVDRLRVDVSLDGKHVARPEQYWVYYRNNGPQICRIYFPDDLSSLQMAVNSMVWQPLAPGRHVLRVAVDQQLPPAAVPAHSITTYVIRVLDREPTAAERAIAPDEDGPKPPADNTPLTFRKPTH